MNRFALLPLMGLAFFGCESATEPAEPPPVNAKTVASLPTPQEVEDLIGGAYADYWAVAHYWRSNAIGMDIMANHGTSTWQNFGMMDLGAEPRQPLSNLNQTSYNFAYVFGVPWNRNYAAIQAASDGLNALKVGVEIGPGGQNNARAEAFATFMQGLSGCNLALIFDRARKLDENAARPQAVPHNAVMNFYMTKFKNAHKIASMESFTLPGHWINGNPLTSTQFAALIRNYQARCAANEARSPAENASANWTKIQQWLDEGSSFQTLFVDGEDAFSGSPWWDGIKTLGGSEISTWMRSHMDWVGMADQSGNYQAWLNTPLQSRTAMGVTTPDLRMPAGQNDGDRGLYQTFKANIIFPPQRGTYRQSHYGDHRWEDYVNSCQPDPNGVCGFFGPMAEMLPVEMDLIRAEAYVETGNAGAAAAILNQTRVGNGGLTPLVGAGTVPTESGGGCVPRRRFDPAGTCGDLRDALAWEHMIEIFQLSGGLTYFFLRGQDLLPAGTSVDFPIPAWIQGTLPGNNVVPTNLEEALTRVRESLDAMEVRRGQVRLVRSPPSQR